MKYYVYVDQATLISRIHIDAEAGGCGAYECRKEDPLPDNWWCGPFKENLEARHAGMADRIREVYDCKKCKFPRMMHEG